MARVDAGMSSRHPLDVEGTAAAADLHCGDAHLRRDVLPMERPRDSDGEVAVGHKTVERCLAAFLLNGAGELKGIDDREDWGGEK